MYVLENFGDFGDFQSLLSAELNRRVRCLDMDGDLPMVRLGPYFDKTQSFELYFQCHRFEVNLTVRYEVKLVFLKSGQSASREEAVEETDGTSIDDTALVSINSDARTWAGYILSPA